MSKKLFVINIVLAVVDTIICALGIVAFALGAVHFERWWILCFALVPLLLFNTHTLVIDSELEEAQKGDENNS